MFECLEQVHVSGGGPHNMENFNSCNNSWSVTKHDYFITLFLYIVLKTGTNLWPDNRRRWLMKSPDGTAWSRHFVKWANSWIHALDAFLQGSRPSSCAQRKHRLGSWASWMRLLGFCLPRRRSRCRTWGGQCHDPLPVGTSLAVEEYRNSREEKDTAELHNIE